MTTQKPQDVKNQLLAKLTNGCLDFKSFGPNVHILISEFQNIDKFNDISTLERIDYIQDCLRTLSEHCPSPLKDVLMEMINTVVPSTVYAVQRIYDNDNQSIIDFQGRLPSALQIKKVPKPITSTLGHKFALRKSKPDPRDKKMGLAHVNLPPKIDLRETGWLPDVLDQGNLGSCVAHGASAALQFCLKKNKIKLFPPSRLYMYYTTRVYIEHISPSDDAGCEIRDVCKAICNYHVCDEKYMPYDTSKYDVAPSGTAVGAARLHTRLQYCAVNLDLKSIKNTLVQNFPIIFGLQIYSSFEEEPAISTGYVPIPNKEKDQLLGGHAMLLIGYNDEEQMFTIRNSWGMVGQEGNFFIPYNYFMSEASDLWCIRVFA